MEDSKQLQEQMQQHQEKQHATNIEENPKPNLIQHTKNFQQMQDKSMPSLNQLELQYAYQDAWRVCHPDFKTPFASLEDACERLLPYHIVADYEAEVEDDIIQIRSRSQDWDDHVAAKVAEFTATFETQVQTFNSLTKMRSNGFRTEERLMIENSLREDERKACFKLKSELDIELQLQFDREKDRTAILKVEAWLQEQVPSQPFLNP